LDAAFGAGQMLFHPGEDMFRRGEHFARDLPEIGVDAFGADVHGETPARK